MYRSTTDFNSLIKEFDHFSDNPKSPMCQMNSVVGERGIGMIYVKKMPKFQLGDIEGLLILCNNFFLILINRARIHEHTQT